MRQGWGVSEHLIQKNYNFIRKLPEWAKTFAIKYCSNTASTFIFHGNIRDFLPQRTEDENFKFVKIQDYFADVLFGYRGKIVCYDRSSGITFIENPYNKEESTKNDFINTMLSGSSYTNKHEKIKKLFTRNLTNSFEILEKYFYKKVEQQERTVLIIDFAETVVPISSSVSFSEEDRFSLVTLKRWSYNPLFIQKDVTVILLTENLYDLNQNVVKSPNIIKIHVPIPDEETREDFLTYNLSKNRLMLDQSITVPTIAKITGGLNLVNINQIISESYQEKKNISLEYLRGRKKELIESESVGMLEIIESETNLDMVSGHTFVKNTLKKASQNIKNGRLDVLPMGYLIQACKPVNHFCNPFTGEIESIVRMLDQNMLVLRE